MKFSIVDQMAIEKFPKKEDRAVFYNIYDAFTNRGIMENPKSAGEFKKYSLMDLVTREDLTRFIPQTVETIVREAIEPNLFIVDRLFQSITIERGTRIQIGAIGAMTAGRVSQGGEYPERMIDLDGGDMVAITTEKYGLKISLTEEVLRENQWDVVNIWMRAAGRALARLKELLAAQLINDMGYDIYNNITPSSSYCGVTTGRDITGAANGSMTANDVFGMYAYLMNRGFSPDTLLMHPLAWKTFMVDPEMREVVLKNSTIASVRAPQGSYAQAWGTSHSGFGLRTTATGNAQTSGNTVAGASPWVQTLNPMGATFNIAPQYLPSPLTVIVTEFVPFQYGSFGYETTDAGSTCNVIMADSNNCGVIGQSMPVETDQWTDPERDIENIKMREAYGFAVLEQGKAIGVARNVAITRNYVFENSNAQTLSTIPVNSGILSGTSL